MKRKQTQRLFFLVLLLCLLVAALAVFSGAETSIERKGSMIEIENSYSEYRLGAVQRIANDGYIGIPVQLSVYYDSENRVTSGIGGTPLILYVVNTATERIGTKTDTEILRSMLDRGYLVCVIDYLEDEKAVTPALDWSLQALRANINAGKYFSGMGIPTADYKETFVVPAGYDVSLAHSFWEIDKHSAAGTLEYIAKVWNTDVRSIFGERVIPWTDAKGNRKSTQDAYDGTTPVWLNASGAADENGTYIKIKHTLAESAEDCVKPDGSPIDMNLYMHIIYPTAPQAEVPVMCFAASSEHLADAVGTAGRPQMNGFVFSGYAGVLMDYGYVPMARADHYKEFSGTAGVTGDNVTYSIAFYNGVKINTAAMRYLRYLAASDETFVFDSEAIGIYGNSKGGWMTMLGAEHPELLAEERHFVGHHGETRYEAGETADSASGLIKGGEEQPWLTYNGVTLDSGADFVYASCGGGEQHITNGHAPTFVSCNLSDYTFYANSNSFVNYCRNHNVPCLWFEINKGHTFAYGEDMNHGVDTYEAFFIFANYYLRGDGVSVVYTSFSKKNTEVDPGKNIVIKFSGAVSLDAVKTIALIDASGNAVSGAWSSQFGNTEWTFTLCAPLATATEYTLTVPATLAGDNGISIGKPYTQSFTTADEGQTAIEFVSGARGGYYFFTVDGATRSATKVLLRFAVESDTSNLAGIYPVTQFSSQSPDSSAVASAAIGSCPIFGKGIYSCDVTQYIKTLSVGDTAAFLVKMERNVGETMVFSAPMDTAVVGTPSMATVEISTEIPDTEGAGALKITGFKTNTITGSKESVTYYRNTSAILSIDGLIKNGVLTSEDLARHFNVSLRVYDTVSRKISVSLTSATSSANGVADYNASRYNYMTKAGEWTEISFVYTVHEPMLGTAGMISKKLSVSADTLGDNNAIYPLYIDSVKVTEMVNAAVLGAAAVAYSSVAPVETHYAQIPEEYADASEYPVVTFVKNGENWEFKSASAIIPTSYGYGTDAVILLRADYAMSASAHNLDTVGENLSLTIDLGGHTLDMTGAGQYNSFSTYAKRNGTHFTLKNGTVYSNGKASLATIYSGGNNTVYLNFENLEVNLGPSFGETSALIRHGYHSPATYTATYNITFADCNIDISAANSEALYAIRAGYFGAGYVLNWQVNGGSLITGSNTFYQKNLIVEKAGSLALGEGSDGQPFKVIAAADLSGSIAYSDLNGTKHYFGVTETDGNAYTHEPVSLATPYGDIPTDKLSPLAYPILLFVKENGAWVYKNAYSTLPTTYGYGAEAALLLRTDYALSSANHKLDTIGANSTLTLDLGGHTLDITKAGQYNSFTFTATASGATFRLTNGSVYSNGKASVICIYSQGNNTANIELSDLEITLGESFGETSALIRHGYHAPAQYHATYNITLNDCDIDISACNKDGLYAIRAGYNGSGGYALNWFVNGGSLITGKSTVVANNLIVQTGGSLTLGKGSDGQPFSVITSADLSGSLIYSDLDGTKHYFGATETDGTTYTHVPMSLQTPYGDIPANRLSVLAYPFVAFEDNGDGTYAYITASANFFTDGGMEYVMRSVPNGVVLLRRDFTVTTVISNLSNNPNRLTIDLGGHTLTTGGTVAPIKSEAKHATQTQVVFTNGTVFLDKTPFISFISTTGTGKTFCYTLKDLTFRYAEGTSVRSAAVIGTSAVAYSLFVTYENCVFDLTESKPSAVVLIPAKDASGKVSLCVTVVGGEVKAASVEGIVLSDAPGALRHQKNDAASYFAIKAPMNENAVLSAGIGLVDWGFDLLEYAPVGVILSHDNLIVDGVFGYTFVDVVVKDGINVAQKTLAAIKPGTLQMNLVLQSKIGVNLFVNTALSNATVKFGGKIYTLADLTASGNYYAFETAIAPNVADEAITVEITIGDNTHIVPVSVCEYAKKILASATYADAHNLTYAMAMYVRVMAKNADFLADVAAPAGYEAKTLEGVAHENDGALLSSIAFRLDETIAIAIQGTTEANGRAVTLKLGNGRKVTATVENGTVIFENLYVNEFYGDLTITIENETYTYSLSNYLHGIGGESTAVQAFYNYAFYADTYVKNA